VTWSQTSTRDHLGAGQARGPRRTDDDCVYLVTDNDGVDENNGETGFIGLGSVEDAFIG